MAECLRGHEGTIGDRLERDLAAFPTPLARAFRTGDIDETLVGTVSQALRDPKAKRFLGNTLA